MHVVFYHELVHYVVCFKTERQRISHEHYFSALSASSAVPSCVASAPNGGRIFIYSGSGGGRPIPDYASVKTPEEQHLLDRQLKEAKAAVDIQRYFRGFVTRRNYKYLLRTERHRREDERAAAVKIQSAYRRHLRRTQRIYARPIDQDRKQWAREYEAILMRRQAERAQKAGSVAMMSVSIPCFSVKLSLIKNRYFVLLFLRRNALNKNKHEARMAIIGPHVDVYM